MKFCKSSEMEDEVSLRTIAYEISDEALPIVEPNYCKRIPGR